MFKLIRVLIIISSTAALSCCLCSTLEFFDEKSQHLLPPERLGAPSHPIIAEHISNEFYIAAQKAEQTKKVLQLRLHNFFDILQRNLSTSSVLNNLVQMGKAHQMEKIENHSDFFHIAYTDATNFSKHLETFFEMTKTESNSLLLKLRNVPTAQGYLTPQAKIYLTDYFAEMEYFHIMFNEVLDEALEYITDTIRTTQITFITYADIQREMIRNLHLKREDWCWNKYMDFLLKWSATIFECATGSELYAVYDIYAMTEVTIKYILRSLEFRVQRLYNCFLFRDYYLKCRFLRNFEKDFEVLFIKLEELQMFYYLRIQNGRLNANRQRHYKQSTNDHANTFEEKTKLIGNKNSCIPIGFPQVQMKGSLKLCFSFPEEN